jgi:hypothetical protein
MRCRWREKGMRCTSLTRGSRMLKQPWWPLAPSMMRPWPLLLSATLGSCRFRMPARMQYCYSGRSTTFQWPMTVRKHSPRHVASCAAEACCLPLRSRGLRLRSTVSARERSLIPRIVEGDLRDGVHRNPDPEGRPEWFTLAFFHRPEELRQELQTAGLTDVQILAVEGPGSFRDLGTSLEDPMRRDAVLRAIQRVETEPTLMGASAHLMAVGRAP